MSIEPLAKGRISVVGGAVALVIITQQAMQEVIWFKHFIFFYESCLNLLSGGYSVETNLFDLPLHDLNSQITCHGYTCKGDSL